jgi:selenocysteine lyase/cysteine desulfurase
MLAAEEKLKDRLWRRLAAMPEIRLLEPGVPGRLGIVSFYSLERHHNLIVQLLNDRFGIQTRGGCSCAGTYGHILLDVDRELSRRITEKIDRGDQSDKPGWVRISLHPTMTPAEVDAIADGVAAVLAHFQEWGREYEYDPRSGEFQHRRFSAARPDLRRDFFPLGD